MPARREAAVLEVTILVPATFRRIYSPERTLIDILRLRYREGPDVAWEGLRRWLARKGSKPAALLIMAKHFHGAERVGDL